MTPSSPETQPSAVPPNAPAVIAHDVFNLLTVLYGYQDELDALPADLPRRAALAASAKGIASRLEDIGRRLVALANAPKQNSESA